MSLMSSIKIPVGSLMPDFTLADPHGKIYEANDLFGEKGLLVIFTCNHCPYANAVWPRLIRIAQHAQTLGIKTVAINPNIHPDYPDDAPEKMIAKMQELSIPFPYLVDAAQKTARSFQAQCTPDVYLFDQKKTLVYHGRIDDNWQDEQKVTRHELQQAVEDLASGQPIERRQIPSMGCSIKWRNHE